MKKWFNSLDNKTKNIISISCSICGLIFTVIGIFYYYLLLLGIPCFIFGFIFDNWNKESKKQEIQTTRLNYKNQLFESELNKYNKLKSNDFEISKSQCNFECSLNIMALNQIKENKNFNDSDFCFNIDERINEYSEQGKQFFQSSKFKNFVALDLETTGLDKEDDRIIQIALVKVENGEIVDTYNKFVNPKKHISAEASDVNGIYDSDVRNEKTIKQLFPEIFDFIGKLPIVAHNASFDMGFLRNEWYRYFDDNFPKHKDICTMKLWKVLYYHFQGENPPSAKLSTLVTNLLNKEDIKNYYENNHDACCDAIATAKVFMKMYDENYLKLLK